MEKKNTKNATKTRRVRKSVQKVDPTWALGGDPPTHFSVLFAFEGPGRVPGGHNGAKCLQNAPKSVQKATKLSSKRQ